MVINKIKHLYAKKGWLISRNSTINYVFASLISLRSADKIHFNHRQKIESQKTTTFMNLEGIFRGKTINQIA